MLKMFLKRLQIKLRKLHRMKGEISIYLCLVFTLIISLLLAVITGARGAALQVAFECAVESALLSVFGEYNRELMERYDVFFIDLSYLSNSPDPKNLEMRLNDYFEDNFHPENGTSFLFYTDLTGVEKTNVSLTEYELATDRFGEPFKDQVVEYMSNLVGETEIERMMDLIAVKDSYSLDEERIKDVKNSLLKNFEQSEEDTWEQTNIKERLCTFVLADPDAMILMGNDYWGVSTESISVFDTLLFRSKEHGSGNMKEFEFNPVENIYFNEYVMSKMGNYLNQRDESKLKYEVEYIVFGKGSDLENMQATVNGLFCLRALEDYISLNLATDKVDKVKAVSTVLEGLIEVPEPIITQTILVGWACAEAVTDVRELLDGKRLPVIKTSEQINVSIKGLVNLLAEDVETGDEEAPIMSEQGIPNITVGYKDYLRLYLYSLPSFLKVYRTMDMIENDLRKSGTGNEFFRFDVCADKVRAVFSVETGFDFRFTGEKKYSYF